jgi:hypothetical protein
MAKPRPRTAADEPRHSGPATATDPDPRSRIAADQSDRPDEGRIVRTATEARQGEIILGRYGRWIWIGSFAALLILLLILAL